MSRLTERHYVDLASMLEANVDLQEQVKIDPPRALRNLASAAAAAIPPEVRATTMRAFFGGSIAVVLLAIYVYAVWMGIAIVSCLSQPNCQDFTAESFSGGMKTALTTIGGLVSALVISVLAITDTGKVPGVPGARIFGLDVSASKPAQIIIVLYLGVWTLAGLAAFVVGYMQHPDVLEPLTGFGQSWFGLAVAAAYAYLELKPPADTGQ